MARHGSACDKLPRLTEGRQTGPLRANARRRERRTRPIRRPAAGIRARTLASLPRSARCLAAGGGDPALGAAEGAKARKLAPFDRNIDRPPECLQGVRPSRVVVGPVSSRTAPVHRVAASRQSRLTITGGQIDRHDETSPAAMGRLSPGPFLLRSLHDMNTLR